MLKVLGIVAVAGALVVAFVIVRRQMSAAVARASHKVLDTLYRTSKPLNLSEIMKLSGQNSGLVTNAIKFLHRRNLVTSKQPVTNLNITGDTGFYYITREGREEVRRRRGLIK